MSGAISEGERCERFLQSSAQRNSKALQFAFTTCTQAQQIPSAGLLPRLVYSVPVTWQKFIPHRIKLFTEAGERNFNLFCHLLLLLHPSAFHSDIYVEERYNCLPYTPPERTIPDNETFFSSASSEQQQQQHTRRQTQGMTHESF